MSKIKQSLVESNIERYRLIMIVIMMIVSEAVVYLSVKSVLARLILHCSDIAIWFLHSILPEHFCACKMTTYKLFVSRYFMRRWYVWNTRYRSFLWRWIEIYTNTTKYKMFSHSSQKSIIIYISLYMFFTRLYVKKLKIFNLKKMKILQRKRWLFS